MLARARALSFSLELTQAPAPHTVIVAVLIPVALRRMWKKDLEQAAVDDVGDEEGLLAPEEDLPSSGARRAYHDEDEERAVGRERAFRLDSDSASEDEDEGEGEEGSQGAWQESRGAAGGSGGGGDMNKASRLLGVTVGKDVVGRR